MKHVQIANCVKIKLKYKRCTHAVADPGFDLRGVDLVNGAGVENVENH